MGSNFNNSAPTGAVLNRSSGELILDYGDLPQQNRLLFDWVSLSTRKHDPGQIMELIGMTDVPWQITKGGNGYTHRYFFGDVSISYSEGSMVNVNGFYLLEMSGQGCRTFETYGNGDYNKLFSLVQAEFGKPSVDQDVRITRLDIAFDDVTGVFDINLICDKTRLEEFVCRMKTYQSIYGNKGNSVTFGRKGSDVFIRIYDKARERGFKASDNKHWVRCELQLRTDAARGVVNNLKDCSVGTLYCSVLRRYLCFKEPSDTESNKSRWEDSPWWIEHLKNAVGISLFDKLGVTYNYSKAEKYVITQPLGAIKSLLAILGPEEFLDFIDRQPMPRNPKYARMISETELEQSRPILTPGKVEFSTEEEMLQLIAEGKANKIELDAIDRDARNKAAVRKLLSNRKIKKPAFVPKNVTCICCGKTASVDSFWTYRGNKGECYDCRNKKIDISLKVNDFDEK